jgi:hypothetical protein
MSLFGLPGKSLGKGPAWETGSKKIVVGAMHCAPVVRSANAQEFQSAEFSHLR